MSEMCFDDFDYDRHSDNCECEECTPEERGTQPTDTQHSNGVEPVEINSSLGDYNMRLQEAISTLRQGIDTILNCDVPYEQLDNALKLVEFLPITLSDNVCEYCQNNQIGNDACVECNCFDSEHEEYIHFIGRELCSTKSEKDRA